MSLTAYIRYDNNNRIVPGGPIVVKDKPAVGNWQPVVAGTNVTLVGQLRAFVKLDRYNKPLAGTLFLGKERPATGKWLEVNATFSTVAPPQPTNTIFRVSSMAETVCPQPPTLSLYYLAPLADGSMLYTDQGLTQQYTQFSYIADPATGNIYGIFNGIASFQFTCPPAPSTTTTTTTIPVYTVGQQALGGIVAYILQPGDPGYDANVQHGLVVSETDAATTSVQWGCYNVDLPGASSVTIGSGASNTQYIVANCSDAGIAAKVSADFTAGGYSDWYLPSRDELNAIAVNKSIIGGFDNGLPFKAYWSSSQISAGSAYYYSFLYNNSSYRDKFEQNSAVRPVRSF